MKAGAPLYPDARLTLQIGHGLSLIYTYMIDVRR
jgi:hypothetical protein